LIVKYTLSRTHATCLLQSNTDNNAKLMLVLIIPRGWHGNLAQRRAVKVLVDVSVTASVVKSVRDTAVLALMVSLSLKPQNATEVTAVTGNGLDGPVVALMANKTKQSDTASTKNVVILIFKVFNATASLLHRKTKTKLLPKLIQTKALLPSHVVTVSVVTEKTGATSTTQTLLPFFPMKPTLASL